MTAALADMEPTDRRLLSGPVSSSSNDDTLRAATASAAADSVAVFKLLRRRFASKIAGKIGEFFTWS
uniref:Uncharacterized protein n=1 Tax=Macrostomum lignano TaxID=282301 RepID=A0A1I8F197_9PLAT